MLLILVAHGSSEPLYGNLTLPPNVAPCSCGVVFAWLILRVVKTR